MNELVSFVNAAGRVFVGFVLPMLIQSSVLILGVLLLDRLLRRRVKAVVRYGLWMLVLLKLVLPPSLASPTSLVAWVGAKLPDLSDPVETIVEAPPVSIPIAPVAEVPVVETPILATEPRMAPPVVYQAAPPAAPEPISSTIVSTAPLAEPIPPLTWRAVAFLCWLAVVAVMLVVLIQRAAFVRTLVAQSEEPPQSMTDLLQQCRTQMKVRAPVSLRLTSLSASPSVCGLWKPRILMPQSVTEELNASQLKSILLHELAHVKRADLWVSLIQALLQIVYFFHPLLWLANLMIRRVREQAVDETVLAAMGDEAENYPHTLLNVSKLAFGKPALSLRLIGVVESKRALTTRIKHIASRPFPKTAKLGLAGFLLVATVAAVLIPMAQAKPKDNGPPNFEEKTPTANVDMPPKAPNDASTNDTITGQVVDPNGVPVIGAQVALGTEDKGAMVYSLSPRLQPTRRTDKNSEIVETDSEGRFSFTNVPEDFVIVVCHEAGFAWIDSTKSAFSTPIRLKRWGRVEGTLYIGDEPAPYETVTVRIGAPRNRHESSLDYSVDVETEVDGQFVFLRVIPGWLSVGHRSWRDKRGESSTSYRLVHVEPGATLDITLGNEGRPVIGQLALPVDSPRLVDPRGPVCVMRTVGPRMPVPTGVDRMTREERTQWYSQWEKSPEGRAYHEAKYYDPNQRLYNFSIDQDNRFRIENVTPGRYDLSVIVVKRPAKSHPDLFRYGTTVEVPPMIKTYNDTPLDLGTVTLTGSPRTDPPPNDGGESSTARTSERNTARPGQPGLGAASGEISGIVTDRDGQPIAKAWVTIENKALLLEAELRQLGARKVRTIRWPHTATDEWGHFKFTDLNPGTTNITISAKDHEREVLRDIRSGTVDLHVQLDKARPPAPPAPPTPYTLSGIVVDETGDPIGGAEVILAEEARSAHWDYTGTSSTVQTNSDGTFRFPNTLEPAAEGRPRRLFARKDGYAVWGTYHPGKGEETFVRITLHPEDAVTGVVMDQDNEPIPNAVVRMNGWSDTLDAFYGFHDWMPFAPQAQTGPDGRFTLTGLPANKAVTLHVTADGFARERQDVQTGEYGSYALRRNDGSTGHAGSNTTSKMIMEFRLQRAVTLRGVVVCEEANVPPLGFWVAVRGENMQSWSKASLDAEGRFEITGVRPIPSNVMVMEEEHTPNRIPEWTAAAISLDDLRPGETRENLRLVLTKGGIVRGRALDGEGHPLQGIWVYFLSSAEPRETPFGPPGIQTNKDGVWAYRFPPGEVRAFARKMERDWTWEPKEQEVTLDAGQTIDGVDFQLTAVLPEDSPYRTEPMPTRSSPDQDYASKDVIAGIVTDPNGRPVVDAQVTIENKALLQLPGRTIGESVKKPVIREPVTRTDAEGRFRFANLNRGVTRVLVTAEGYRSETLETISPGTTTLRVQLGKPRPYTLSGAVVDSEGVPLPSVKVILASSVLSARGGWTGTSSTTETDANGAFKFSETFRPETNRHRPRALFALKGGYGLWSRSHDSTGAETSVRITMQPEEMVSGLVTNTDGRPVAEALVKVIACWHRDALAPLWLRDWTSFTPQTWTSTNGRFTLAGLPTDSTISLGVSAEDYAAPDIRGVQTGEFGMYAVRQKNGAILSFGPDAGSETPVEFILERGVTLRGAVVYEETNAPAVDIRVAVQGQSNGSWSEAHTNSEGRFEMVNVRPAPCNLMVLLEGPAEDRMPDWTAQAISLDDLKPGEIHDNLQLVLTKGGIVQGKVVDAKGHPLQGIGIGLHSSARPRSSAAIESTITGEDGTWTYRLPPGQVYAYIAMRRDDWTWKPEKRTVTLSAGQTLDNVDFQLTTTLPANSPYRAKPIVAPSDLVAADAAAGSKNTRTIHGVVTDTLGRPRQCVYVAPQGKRVWDGVMSDVRGRFVLEDVTADQKVWVAYSQASRLYSVFRIPENDSSPLRVTLDLDEAEIEGRVVGADGKALPDRQVELVVTTASGLRFPVGYRPKTDAFGYYSHDRVPCGDGVTIEVRMLDNEDQPTAFTTGPVKVRAKQGFIEMPPLAAAKKKIQPNFDRNLRNDGMFHCSGRVVDEKGKPIRDARVRLSFNIPNHVSTWGKNAMTDSAGHWRRAIPPQGVNLRMEVEHPEFYVEESRTTPVRVELEKGTHVVTMKPGCVLKGNVVDEQGRPIENALLCADRFNSYTPSPYNQIIEDSTTARTRKDGSFHIGGLPPGTRTIAAYSDNHAPAIEKVNLQENVTSVTVTLRHGKTYRGKVVNAQGEPLEGARIGIDDWYPDKERRNITRVVHADAQGRFAMTNLPEGRIELDFSKKTYMGFSKDLPEDLSQTEEVVMYDVPVFTGRVLDAETHEPVTEFQVVNGIRWKRQDTSYRWSRYYRSNVKDPNGVFSQRWGGYSISYPFSSVACIKIKAPGYLPAIAPPQELDQPCKPLTIRLRKGISIAGTVVQPNGTGAAKAQVGFIRPDEKAFIDRDQFSAAGFAYQAEIIEKTDESGKFELPPTEAQGLIVAVHKSGYGQAPSAQFENGSSIRLTPWSRIEGAIDRSQTNGDPMEIALYRLGAETDRDKPGIHWLFDGISATGDTFVFECVPAVPLSVGRIDRYEMNDATYLKPEPGKTYSVVVGRKGRTVAGEIVCPDGLLKDKSIELTDPRQTHAVAFHTDGAGAPAAEIGAFEETSFTWLWQDKERVYKPSQTVRKRFVPDIDKEGRFTFVGLEPGEYEFVVNLHAPLGENVSCGRGVLEGVAVSRFTVPQGGNGTLRIPDVQIQHLTYPGVGEPAPLFEAKTFEGKTIRLRDLRGKIVLLDFWASWCSPCVAQLPKVQALYKEFGERENFAMIGLSLDWDAERAQRLLAEKQLGWQQACLGSMDESTVVRQYGIGGIPMMVLIDAEGAIIARGADTDQSKQRIEEAIDKTR